ncbi:MAG: hypothetical protein ABL921_26030 [Pirellula sp.]
MIARHLGKRRLAAIALAIGLASGTTLYAESSGELIRRLQNLGTGDQYNQDATSTIKQLNAAKDVTLVQTLIAMKGSTPVGRNWLLGLANSLYRKSGTSQNTELNSFLLDGTQDGEARYTVFQWLTSNNPELRKTLLAKMQQDPSLELRYLAISEAVEAKPESKQLQSLLDAARHPEQVVDIIKKLKEMGTTIDQPKQFGFILDWKLIGPFDNVGTLNFDKSFPVENDWVAGTVKEEYAGKSGPVQWKSETSGNEEGIVDLAALYTNEKGCIIYAMTEFESDKEQDAELRLGCINGNKTWLNGKLVMSNEVYHTNMQIDQYNEKVRLKAGKNKILVKICQNEQTEQWAQRYAFQFRVSDSTGKAILAKGR